jgi:hypothetical protein
MFKAIKHADNTMITSGGTPTRTHISVLPWEILQMIFAFLSKYEQFVPALVCKDWYYALTDMRRRRGEEKWTTSIERVFATPTLMDWAMHFFDDIQTHTDESYKHFFAPDTVWKSIAAGGNMELCQSVLSINQFVNTTKREVFISELAKYGHYYILKWLFDNKHIIKRDFFGATALEMIASNATKSGNMQLLSWLISIECVFTSNAYNGAIMNKHYGVIDWLIKIECAMCPSHILTAVNTCSLEMVQFLCERNFPLCQGSIMSAIEKNEIEMLKRLIQYNSKLPDDEKIIFNIIYCKKAAYCGHLEILKLFHQMGCPFDEKVISTAAGEGHFEIVKYLRGNGCPWDEDTFTVAVGTQKMDLLEYLYRNGCPYDENATNSAADAGNLNILKWLVEELNCPIDDDSEEDVIQCATRSGNLDIIKYLHERDCRIDELSVVFAAVMNNVTILEYFAEHIVYDPDVVVNGAINNGSIDALNFFWDNHQDEIDWDDQLYESSIVNNHPEVMQWLHSKGVSISPDLLKYAIECNNIDICNLILSLCTPTELNLNLSHIIYMVTNGTSGLLSKLASFSPATKELMGDDNCIIRAISNKNLDVLKWLHSNIKPFKMYVFHLAAEEKFYDLIEWGSENGYECDF